MTIHQPSYEIFEMFDGLLLMIEGGIVYQGPANKAVHYFDSEFGLRCPSLMNPADFLVQSLHQDNSSNVARYPAYLRSYHHLIEPVVTR